MTKSGAGTLFLAGGNSFTGGASVSAGTLDLCNQNALQASTLTAAGGLVVFDSSVSSRAFTIGALGGSTNLALQDNASPPDAISLTLGGNNASSNYSGDLGGSGSLIKAGTGTLVLSGTNTYNGATTISGGTLQLGGTAALPGGTASAWPIRPAQRSFWAAITRRSACSRAAARPAATSVSAPAPSL